MELPQKECKDEGKSPSSWKTDLHCPLNVGQKCFFGICFGAHMVLNGKNPPVYICEWKAQHFALVINALEQLDRQALCNVNLETLERSLEINMQAEISTREVSLGTTYYTKFQFCGSFHSTSESTSFQVGWVRFVPKHQSVDQRVPWQQPFFVCHFWVTGFCGWALANIKTLWGFITLNVRNNVARNSTPLKHHDSKSGYPTSHTQKHR